MEKVLNPRRRLHVSMLLPFILGFFWYLLHLAASIRHIGSRLIQVMVCYMISVGLLEKYRVLPVHKLQHLGVVIDSEEAKDTARVKRLLHWLSEIGLKYIILYDMEGVLKRALDTNQVSFGNSKIDTKSYSHVISGIHRGNVTVEVLSSADSKEGAAKAANFLFSSYLKGDKGGCNKIEPKFMETDIAAALKAVGCDGPDPDLLLIYGPARCHFGFPAWRIRYTEIVHMGPLKSMTYGTVVKAIYDFSKKHQNYGT